jgi:hypothetical protein
VITELTWQMRFYRPRISILTALLLMTILGMGIVIAQLWREIGPLRAELTARRAEMGQLFVRDTTKSHAIGVDWNDDGVWRWRLFLPPPARGKGNNWVFRTYIGKQPMFDGDDLKTWLAGPRAGKDLRYGSIGGVPAGREFTFDVKLAKDSDGWYLQEGKGRAKERIPKSFNVWLEDPNHRFPISKVASSNQTIYEPGTPIVLLCIQRANESQNNGVDGDTILVWIEEHH